MAKKKSKKSSRKKARPAKKVAKRTTAPRKSAKVKASKSTSRSKTGTGSVDSLLKKFDLERKQKETQLATFQKKRDELTDKAAKLREQIESISKQISETETQVSSIESRRDNEVKELLMKLGVKLENSGSTSPANSSQDGFVRTAAE